jgi:hypothetical protein
MSEPYARINGATAVQSAAASPVARVVGLADTFAGGRLAWSVSHEISRSSWSGWGEALVAGRSPSRWALGDWVLYGRERFGVRYASASSLEALTK